MARNIAVQADGYAKAFKTMLADPSVQRFTIRISRTVSPVDLAPRPKGRNLSAPCDGRVASALPYDGTLRGTFHAGGIDTNLGMVLKQDGGNVSGSFGYGNGIGRCQADLPLDAGCRERRRRHCCTGRHLSRQLGLRHGADGRRHVRIVQSAIGLLARRLGRLS